VKGLQSIEHTKTMFIIGEHKIFQVGIEHVIATLPMPKVEIVEDGVKYLFSSFDIHLGNNNYKTETIIL